MAKKVKNKIPKGDAGKAVTKILESRFDGIDEDEKNDLIGELSQSAKDYFDEYNSEENVSLRDYYTMTALDDTDIIRGLGELDLILEDFLDKNFYETLHMIYEKHAYYTNEYTNIKDRLDTLEKSRNSKSKDKNEIEKLKKQKQEIEAKIEIAKGIKQKVTERADTSVIEAKAYKTSELYRESFRAENGNAPRILSTDFLNAQNLEEFLDFAKLTTYSNKLLSLGIRSNIEMGNGLDTILVDASETFRNTYAVPIEVEEKIKSDSKHKKIWAKFLGEISECKYEKLYIDEIITELKRKYPELSDKESKEAIVVFRSGILDENSKDANAKNRYQAYTEEEHIRLGGNGTNSGIATAYLSVTESAIVLPVYNLSKRDSQKVENVPMIIDVRKIYEMLLERKNVLENNLYFEGEKEFLELISEFDLGRDDAILDRMLRLEELEEANVPQYTRRKDLPEGFFNRDKLVAPEKKGKDPHTLAYASSELLFKSSIPSESITEISPLVMDMIVATVGTDVYSKIIEQIMDSPNKGNSFSNQVIDLVNKNGFKEYGLNSIELDFIQRFYINREPIENYIFIPEMTLDDEKNAYRYLELKDKHSKDESEKQEMQHIENELSENGIIGNEIEALGYITNLKKLNEMRKEQVELGIRTSIVKKILGSQKFLEDIGIDLQELGLTPESFQEKLGKLIQPTTSEPEKKHKRYDDDGKESYTENARPYIDSSVRPDVKGTMAADELVKITSKEYSIEKAGTTRFVRPTPKKMELNDDNGELQYEVFQVSKFEEHQWPDRWIKYSAVLSTPTLKRIPFQVKHHAKNAAKSLEKIVTYYLEDKNNENNIQENPEEER